jgi:hypothetical protein
MNDLIADTLFAAPPAPYYALNRAEAAEQRQRYQAAAAVVSSNALESARRQAEQEMSDAEHRLAMSGHAIEPTDLDRAQAEYDALTAQTTLQILKDLDPDERTLRVEKLKGAWRRLVAARAAAEAARRDDGDVQTTPAAAEVPELETTNAANGQDAEYLAPVPYWED